MLNQIHKYFFIPTIGSDFQRRAQVLLSVFLICVELASAIFILLYFINGSTKIFDLWLVSICGVLMLGLHYILWRGYVRWVGWMVPILTWVCITLALVLYGSMRDTTITAYFFVLILASLVIGEIGTLVVGGLIALSTVGIFFAEMHQLIEPTRNTVESYDLIVFIGILLIVIFLLRSAVREINLGFKGAEAREKDLDALNTQLEQRVQERTAQWQTANQELQAVKDRLQYLIAYSPAVIYTARVGGEIGTTYVSENVLDRLGYQPHEFVDDSSFWLSHIHPDERATITAQFHTLIEKGYRIFEYQFRHHDGSYRWLRDEARLMCDPNGTPIELIGSWTDITTRKQTELALIEKDHLLQNILDNTSTLIIAKEYRHTKGNYIFVNPTFAQMLEKTPDQFINLKVYDIYPPDIAKTLDEHDRLVYETQEISRREEHVIFSDGPHTLLSNKFPLYDALGTPYGVCIVATDITEREQIEKERRVNEERYRLLAKNLPGSIVMLYDQNLRFILTDGPELEKWGYTRSMVEGKLLHEALPSEFAQFVEPFMRRALNGERYSAVLPYWTFDNLN